MKRSHAVKRESVGLVQISFVVLLVCVSFFVSPLPASASSTDVQGTLGTASADRISVSGRTQPDHQAILDFCRTAAEKEKVGFRTEVDRRSASREDALAQIEASAKRIASQSSQEEGLKKSTALWRLKKDVGYLKTQLPREARALGELRDAAVQRVMARASDALIEAEKKHSEPDNQRKQHLKEAREWLKQERRDTLSLLDEIREDDISQARTRIAWVTKELSKAITEERKKERGPIVGYKTVHRKGHTHSQPIYQNERDRR